MRASEAVAMINGFEDPDQIATFLAAHGIKGIPEDSSSCAISRWVETNVECHYVETSDVIAVYGHKDADEDGSNDYDISTTVQRFITLFDNGYYPDLIEDSERYLYENETECDCPGCAPNYES